MPKIVIEQPGIPSITLELTEPETRLGRAEDNDFVLLAEEVSRYHAKIRLVDDKTILDDLKSMNGTYVNEQRIVERVLSDQDEIWLGSKCKAAFHDDPEPVRASRKQKALHTPLVKDVEKIREEMNFVTASMAAVTVTPPPERDTPTTQPETFTDAPISTDSEKFQRAFRRLNALYRASDIMASDPNLDERMKQVLDLVMEVTAADRGFLMLREEGTEKLEVKMARGMGHELEGNPPSMGIARRAAIDGEYVLMGDSQSDSKFGGRESVIMQRITSAMCVPLQIEDRILGSLYVDARNFGTSFTSEDLELFSALAGQSAMALENVRLYDQMVESEKKRANFGRFLSPSIVDMIMEQDAELTLGGEKRLVATMFADIRGFTPLSEGLTPDQLVELLNTHFTALTEIVFEYQGTLDKYIGDEVMALFGAPISGGNDAQNAVRAAVAMQEKNRELNDTRTAQNLPTFEIGIGINTGEVFSGYIGSPDRMDFTVIGDNVNVGARFCSVAKAGQIIIGQSTYDLVKDVVIAESIGATALKGKSEDMEAYSVTGLRG